MAKRIGEGAALVYRAAETFVDRALRREDSLFTPGVAIWTERTAEDLHKRFVEQPDTSGDTFEQKFKRQLAGAPAETIQLAAEILFVHFLIVSPKQAKGGTKRKRIEAVLSWCRKPVEIPTELANALDEGLCHAGQAFAQYRPQQLWFLVKFVIEWTRKTNDERRTALADPWVFKKIVFSVPAQSARLQQHALLHLVHPQTFEPTVSEQHKQRMVEAFATEEESTEPDIDRQLIRVRERLSQEYGEGFSFYSDQIRSRWDTDIEDNGGGDDDPSHAPRYWVEKVRVSGRPDRERGPHALGHALWSPQLSEDGRAYYRAMRDVKPGDVVFHFVDNRHIVGVSRIAGSPDDSFVGLDGTDWAGRPAIRVQLSDYTELAPAIERQALFDDPKARIRLQEIHEAHRGLFFNKNLELNQGSYLTEAPAPLVKLLNDIYRAQANNDLPLVGPEAVSGTGDDVRQPRVLTLEWLEENTLWPQERLTEIVQVLKSKSPHVVLAGPPGTGKTWIAQLIARFITDDNPNHYRLVQFHPSYSYEAFIEGLRPVAENNAVVFTPVRGLILSIEEKHRGNERPFVIIVDEMNRATLPLVFGELMFLLEYRDREIDLQYTKAFRLPPTIKIIGTMNTADRSIRSIDVALRRRFDFFECPPDVRVLERYFTPPHVNEVPSLFDGFIELNKQLTASLDRHHTIGHTVFMKELLTADDLLAIWRRKIKPLVEDYFFDQPDIAAAFLPERFWPELAE